MQWPEFNARRAHILRVALPANSKNSWHLGVFSRWQSLDFRTTPPSPLWTPPTNVVIELQNIYCHSPRACPWFRLNLAWLNWARLDLARTSCSPLKMHLSTPVNPRWRCRCRRVGGGITIKENCSIKVNLAKWLAFTAHLSVPSRGDSNWQTVESQFYCQLAWCDKNWPLQGRLFSQIRPEYAVGHIN